MAKTYPFVVSDENVVNSYGFRVMTAGIDIKQYKRNNLVLWYHKRPSRWDGNEKDAERFPIGLATNLRKVDGQLVADIEFDQEDDFAKTVEGKVDRGFIKMCSAGLSAVEISDDVKLMLQGQTRATLKKSILVEISIVDIGSNPNSLRLYDNEMELVTLGAGGDNDIIPLVSDKKDSNQNSKRDMEFKQQVAVALGLDSAASDQSVMDALNGKIQLAQKANDWEQKYNTLNTEVQAGRDAAIVALVDAAVDTKITADKKEKYVALGKQLGKESLEGILADLPAMRKPGDEITEKNKGVELSDDGHPKDWANLIKLGDDQVEKFKKEHEAEYIKLFEAEFKMKPDLES